MTQNKQQQPQTLAQLKILAAAIAFSTVLLLVVSFVLNSQIVDGPGLFQFYVLPGLEMVTAVLAFATLWPAGLSFVIPKFLDKTPVDPMKPHVVEGGIFFYNWNHFQASMFATTIVRLALSESVAIFGFLISFMNHSFFNMIPFVVVSLYLQFLWGPFYQKKSAL